MCASIVVGLIDKDLESNDIEILSKYFEYERSDIHKIFHPPFTLRRHSE